MTKPHEQGVGTSGTPVQQVAEKDDEIRRVLKRFTAEASPEMKREFARSLVGALDSLGVEPDAEFVVLPKGTYDSIIDKMDRLRDKADEAEAKAEEAERDQSWAESTLEEAQELLADVDRGIRDWTEVRDALQAPH